MSDMANKIREALAKLDPANDMHWTSDGSPRMDVVEDLVGDKSIKRADVTAAAPAFTRENPVLDPAPAAQEPSPTNPEEPTDLDELEARLAEAEARLAEAEAVANAARRRMLDAQRARDAVIEARDRARPVHENQLGIMQFLKSQARIREQRAARMRALQEQMGGVDPRQLNGRAPIDQAMAHKRGFGQNRPQVPLRRE